MIKSRITLAGALLAVAGAANAGFTVTPTVTSDYDWRGVSQTMEDPAFQLGVNWTHDSGFYVGAWGSNVDFGTSKPDFEIDAFAGFAGGDATESFAYDVGVNYYGYPDGGSAAFTELYAGITKSIFGAKLWYSPEYGAGTKSAMYAEGNVNYPLPSGFSVLAHVGYSFGKTFSDSDSEYVDYSAGVGYAVKNINLTLKYVNSNDLNGLGRNAWIGSISTTLPWASE